MRVIMRGECSADDNTGTNSVFLHISQNTGLPYCFIKNILSPDCTTEQDIYIILHLGMGVIYLFGKVDEEITVAIDA